MSFRLSPSRSRIPRPGLNEPTIGHWFRLLRVTRLARSKPNAVLAKRRRRAKAIASLVEDAHFRTIDLDVRSRRSLTPLVSAWPGVYQPLPSDSRWLILNAFDSTTAEAAAKELLQHISRLRGAARQCWKQAHRRMFDIGVQAGGPGSRAFEEVRLTADTLRRIAAAGAQIQVTVYPAEPASED